MDTIQLDELLECSVCLEQLDETSKVLPCQHTFCRRCLKEIVERRKELRCPECRILVDANIDDLPSNIFLVRLLEGLKKQRKPLETLYTEHQESSSDQGHACAKALYDYEPQEAGDLPLHKGEIITLLRQVDENWYEGHAGDLRGFLPANYIEVIQPLPSLDVCDMPIAKALYDFEDEQEHDLLTFKSGDMIHVVRRVDENWCEGKLNTKFGIFPITFVELNTAARNLIEGNDVNANEFTMAPGGNVSKSLRSSPSESKDSGEPKRHTMHFVGQRVEETRSIGLQRHSLDITSTERLAEAFGGTSGNSASSTGRQETTPSSSSTCNNSFDQAQSSPPRSGGSVVEFRAAGGSRPASAEIGKEVYVALYNYKPIKDDELELSRGESYYVTEKCKDGWFKGFHVSSQKRGVFPGNYVRLASIHNLLTSSRSSSPDFEVPSSLSSLSSNPQQQQQQHQQRPPPRRTSSEGGSHTRYHRSDSAPPYAPRAALALESLVVNLDQGGDGSEGRTAGDWNALSPTSPFPPTPAPKSSSFWKKLKGKKKDKTRMTPPPPPPPPYQRCLPAGHSTMSPSQYPIPPLYDIEALSNTQGTRGVSPSTKLHHRVENPPVRERYRVIVAYPPQNEAELDLRVGDVVYVTKKRQDGWYKGTLERNGKTGLFPGSFVGSF